MGCYDLERQLGQLSSEGEEKSDFETDKNSLKDKESELFAEVTRLQNKIEEEDQKLGDTEPEEHIKKEIEQKKRQLKKELEPIETNYKLVQGREKIIEAATQN